jgi:hypothetical protein
MGAMVEWRQIVFKCDRWYQNMFLGLIGKSSKASTGGEQVKANGLRRTQAMVEPNAKKKYKTKKEKKKDIIVEELMIATYTMVGEEFLDKEAQVR